MFYLSLMYFWDITLMEQSQPTFTINLPTPIGTWIIIPIIPRLTSQQWAGEKFYPPPLHAMNTNVPRLLQHWNPTTTLGPSFKKSIAQISQYWRRKADLYSRSVHPQVFSGCPTTVINGQRQSSLPASHHTQATFDELLSTGFLVEIVPKSTLVRLAGCSRPG